MVRYIFFLLFMCLSLPFFYFFFFLFFFSLSFFFFFFFFSSRRRHTRSLRDWSSDVCSSDLLANFGAYATPERNLVFDLNDFDETLPAPWEWDVKRLTASIVVAARTNGFRDRKSVV